MKNTMKIKVFFLTLMFAVCALAEPKVSASCSRRAISMDESLRYTVTVENAKNASPPTLGEMDGFRVIMGPSQSSNISIVNGVQSSSQEFSYELQAVRTGKLTIGESKVKVDGKTYNLPKITIDVSEARKSSANSPATTEVGGELFLELDASTTNTFLGEQIFLTITLYYKDVNLSDASQPELQFTGFNVQDIGKYQQDRQRYRGQIYNYLRFQKLIIPLKAGKLSIGPANMRVAVNVPIANRSRSRDPFDDPFSLFQRYRTVEKNVVSEPLAINVKNLPSQNKPKDFKGAVGRFALDAEVTPKKVKEGEPVTLKLTLTGIGNIDQAVVDLASTNATGFTVYDPVVDKKTSVADGQLKGIKTYSQMWVPLSSEITELPAVSFSYFDTAKNDYQTLTAGPFPLTVEKSAQSQKVTVSEAIPIQRGASPAIKILNQDIFGIKLESGDDALDSIRNRKLLLAAALIPPAFFILCALFALKRSKEEDPSFKRKSQAYSKAEQNLKKAKKLKGKPEAIKDFCGCLSAALNDYVADTLDLPKGSISADTIEDPALKKEWQDLMTRIEMARFAGNYGPKCDNDQLLSDTSRLLKELRRTLK
jgi:hypothetical protein